MQLEGEVQVTYQGYVLKSEEATYFADTGRIVLPKRATVAGNGLEVEGSRMEVELEVKKVRLLQNVKTKIEPDKVARKDKRPGAEPDERRVNGFFSAKGIAISFPLIRFCGYCPRRCCDARER